MTPDLARTALLLLGSNAFMTVAWYGHLKFKGAPLLLAIAVSWLIALPEYAIQVPANRFGHASMSAPQLKILQEAVTIAVFLAFNALYLREAVRWNHAAAFLLILAGVAVAVWKPAP